MSNSFFRFRQFTIHQDACAMKVTTDGCLFGAWAAKQIAAKHGGSVNCLDIGTGTGLLSLMVAQQNAAASIHAIEIDTAATAQAIANIAAAGKGEQITVTEGDIKKIPAPGAPLYQVIFSNPPFYENELVSPDPVKNKAHHGDGLTLPELFQRINNLLLPDGFFYLLLPYKRYEELLQLFATQGLAIRHLVKVRHTPGHSFTRLMVEGRPGSASAEPFTVEEIAIRDADNHYSPSFTALLKDYYEFL